MITDDDKCLKQTLTYIIEFVQKNQRCGERCHLFERDVIGLCSAVDRHPITAIGTWVQSHQEPIANISDKTCAYMILAK